MDDTTLAYLAGAIDSDGSIGIKRSTYHIRVRKDAVNATYSERILLKQVTPHIPELLRECFGGSFQTQKASTEDGKPLYSYACTDKNAAIACELMLPYLRIKKPQAQLVLELRESKQPGYGKFSYWFELENPEWRTMPLVTSTEAMEILGYTNKGSLSQAIKNGTILALPYNHDAIERPRIPRLLLEQVIVLAGKDGFLRNQPPQLVEWRERLCQEVRELNKNGVNGTGIYRRVGYHAPIQ